ncbi:MAG: PKD domain-containing protein, partial [Actinomycetota bacterium]
MRRTQKPVVGAMVSFVVLLMGVAAFQVDNRVVSSAESTVSSLWLPAPTTGEIVEIDPLTGDVMSRVEVSAEGADLQVAAMETGVVVVDRSDGVVSLVDPALHQVTRTRFATGAIAQVDLASTGVVVGTAVGVGVIDLEVRTEIRGSTSQAPTSVAANGTGAAAVVDDEIILLSAEGVTIRTGEEAERTLRAGAQALFVRGRDVVDESGTVVSCLPQELGPDAAITGSPEGLVAATGEQSVYIADTEIGSCSEVLLGAEPGGLGEPVIAGQFVYIPENAAGTVHVVDTRAERATAYPVARGAEDLRLITNGDLVAVYDQGSSFVALVNPNGIDRVLDSSSNAGLGFDAVLGDDGAAALDGSQVEGAVSQVSSLETAVLAAELRRSSFDDEPAEEELESDSNTAEASLVANFAFSASTVVVGETVQFVDESVGGPVVWLWDFGDGTTAIGPTVEKAWLQPGTYPVTLTVAVGQLEDSVSFAITVVAEDVEVPPNADFQATSQVVSVGSPVSFLDRSTGDPTAWFWEFGDGATASGPNVEHTWSSPGTYIVALTVSNGLGADTAQLIIEVVADLEPPVVEASIVSTTFEVGAPIGFVATSTTDEATFSWSFGDGGVATGPEVTHVFADPGEYLVQVVGANDAGEDTVLLSVTIVEATVAPVARIGPLPTVIEVEDQVTLVSQSLNAPDSLTWSFGDGATDQGETVSHAWQTPGTYLVTLTAQNDAGADSTTVAVDVVEQLPPPIAVISAFDPSPWVGDPVVFGDGSINAETWLWDFGDGTTSAAQNTVHTFATTDPATVTLAVTNRNGSDSTSVVVTPRLQPIAQFSFAPGAITAGDLVGFVDQSANAVSWSWDFGDGSTATVASPSHAFAAAGTYTVTLTIRTAAGDADSASQTLVVDPAPPIPVLALGAGSGSTGVPLVVDVTPSAASGPILTYEIDFGDGTTTSNASGDFAHTYAGPGVYTVQTRAVGPLATSAWMSAEYTVIDAPVVSIVGGLTGPSVADLSSVSAPSSGPVVAWKWTVS